MDDFVTIRHPDIEGSAQVVRAALEFLQPKGWQVVDDPAPEAAPEAAPAPSGPPTGTPDAPPTTAPAPNLLES